MASRYEEFWAHHRYAFVGNSAKKPFPAVSYAACKAQGKTAYAVDEELDGVDGDRVYRGLGELPGEVDGVVLEVPAEETASWIQRVADAGVKRAWIHQKRETPEALALANRLGLSVCYGTCAVQYLGTGFPHSVHRFFRKLRGNW